jgi:hypothetical protein
MTIALWERGTCLLFSVPLNFRGQTMMVGIILPPTLAILPTPLIARQALSEASH